MRVGCSPTTLRANVRVLSGSKGPPPRPKKARMSRLQEKAVVVPFFDSQWLIHTERVPRGQTGNKEYYLAVLKRFREKMRKKRPQQWRVVVSPRQCHKSMLVTNWMADRGMKTIQHPSYSPDLVPLRLLPVSTHERQPQRGQVSFNRGTKKSIGKILKGLLKKDLEEIFQD